MKILSQAAQSIWAKKFNQDGNMLWLPLTAHLTDTVFVVKKLWNCWLSDGVKQAISEGLSKEDCAEQLIVFLAAIHDLGKATPVFESKQARPLCRELDEQIAEKLLAAGLPIRPYRDFPDANKTPHALATEVLLEHAGCNRNVAAILGSHHGKPPELSGIDRCGLGTYGFNYHLEKEGKDAWTAVQRELLSFALDLAGFSCLEEIPKPNMAAQVLLSGLIVMADWIASNESYFPYIRPAEAPRQCLNMKTRDKSAWEQLSLPKPWNAGNVWMSKDLYRERFAFTPRVLQEAVAQTAAAVNEPGILVLEAPMGAGKTEAALVCAEIFANKAKRTGIFFALPTQATSNGIFPRILEWIKNLELDEKCSIKLAHGKAQFNEEYEALKHFGGSVNVGEDQEEEGAVVHEWFDGQKKSLLADMVVGTIDQLLLAALKQKHVMLRHLGLADKVVIIDECHAYDAYMGQYLNRALNWLGAYRVPVIVLSATLPAQKRQAVIDAYLNKNSAPKPQNDPLGRNVSALAQLPEWVKSRAYPQLTYTDGGEVKQKAVSPGDAPKEVRIDFITEDSIADKLDELLSGGGCAGVIVNTVKRAQELTKTLRARFDDETVRLLHSRFLAPDRAEKEQLLLGELGKPSKVKHRPSKLIVVGTQVLEQSLDIDFDVLLSDLCPMDLLLQRIGRLHRHERKRPEKLSTACCLVISSEDDGFEPGTEKIYGDYLLMRTKTLLPQRLLLPLDIPQLVQDTYDESVALSPEPSEYKEAKKKWDNLIADKEKRARDFRIENVWPGAMQNLVGWLDTDVSDRQGEAAVRDSDESIEVLVIRQKSNGRFCFLPWINDGGEISPNEVPKSTLAKTLARQRLTLPRALCAPWMIDRTIAELEKVNSEWIPQWQQSVWLKGELFLILDEQCSASLCGYLLIYDREYGLLYEKEEQDA